MALKTNMPKVSEIMTKNVLAFERDFSVHDAVRAFNKHRISSAPVINANHEILGYLSEADCIQCLANYLFYDEVPGSIETIMKSDVLTVPEHVELFELEKLFEEYHLKHAPVVDSEGHLVGMVSRRNVMMALENKSEEVLRSKEKEREPIEVNLNALLNLPHRK